MGYVMKSIINRRINYDYEILEKLECGIVLQGNEVKSIRDGHAHIKESWCVIENGEVFIRNMTIDRYRQDGLNMTDEKRDRKLLAHKNEIIKLSSKLSEKGISLVVSRLYMNKGRVKAEICLCRGKHNYDKRRDIRERDLQREARRDAKTEGW